MHVVITGDVANSQKNKSQDYLPIIEHNLTLYALPDMITIYRGDSFQAILKDANNGMRCAVSIKAGLKTTSNLDVRIAIGLGDVEIIDNDISKSTGSAFTLSGHLLDNLKEYGQQLMVASNHPIDTYMNTCLKMGLLFMDSWTVNSAQIIYEALKSTDATQAQLGAALGIKQATASRRLVRAHWQETKELIALFEKYYKDVSHGLIP